MSNASYNYQWNPGHTFYPQVKDGSVSNDLLATVLTHVHLEIAQNEKSTVAVAELELDGEVFRAASTATKNPKDRHVAEIGLQLAAARALESIVRQLKRRADGKVKHQQDMKEYRKKQGKV